MIKENKTTLIVEVATEHRDTGIAADGATVQIQAAAGYTSSLMDILRMARGLDDVEHPGDQNAFNEGMLTVCRVVQGLQDLIVKKLDQMNTEEDIQR